MLSPVKLSIFIFMKKGVYQSHSGHASTPHLTHFFLYFGIQVKEVREFYNYQETFNLFIGIVYLVNKFLVRKNILLL